MVRPFAVCLLISTVALAQPQGQSLRMRLIEVPDADVGERNAFQLLVPADWQAQGGITWRHDLSCLVLNHLKVTSPDGLRSLEFFPSLPYAWQEGGVAFFPQGSVYLGNIVWPPTPIDQYVSGYVVQQFRPGVQVQLVGREALPEVVKVVAQQVHEAQMTKQVVAERFRLAYRENGRDMHEDVYCVMVYTTGPFLPGYTLWGPNRIYSFKAPAGELDEKSPTAPLFHAMSTSVRINPVWMAKYQQVVQMWMNNQNQAIRNAGEISRIWSRMSNEVSDIQRQAYEDRQRSQDRVNEQFSRYIRGVEVYDDPVSQRPVTLPSGYDNAWVNSSGEYILTNQAGYNPNEGSTLTWQRMGVRPLGE